MPDTLLDPQGRFEVPGAQFPETGFAYEDGETGKVPHCAASATHCEPG